MNVSHYLGCAAKIGCIVFFMVALVPGWAPAQTWSQVWAARSDGPGKAWKVEQANDGGFFVVGSFIGGPSDAWVTRLDAYGEVLWEKRLRGAGSEDAIAVAPTSDGGCAVKGWTDSFGSPDRDAWIVKLDALGRIEWQWQIGSEHDESNTRLQGSIEQTRDEGFILSIDRGTEGLEWTYALALKLDRAGNIVWQKRFGADEGLADLISIRELRDGGYVGVGSKSRVGGWVVRLADDGSVLWERGFDSAEPNRSLWPISVVETGDSGIAIAGATADTTGLLGEIRFGWVMKLDSDGALQWRKEYGRYGDTVMLESLQQTPDDGLAILIYTKAHGHGPSANAWILKLDSRGTIRWQKAFGGEGPNAEPRTWADNYRGSGASRTSRRLVLG